MINEEFKDITVWPSEHLENEPIGLEGLRELANEVYKTNEIGSILNPLNREIKRPDFLEDETVKKTSESKYALFDDDDEGGEDSEFSNEQIQEYIKKTQHRMG